MIKRQTHTKAGVDKYELISLICTLYFHHLRPKWTGCQMSRSVCVPRKWHVANTNHYKFHEFFSFATKRDKGTCYVHLSQWPQLYICGYKYSTKIDPMEFSFIFSTNSSTTWKIWLKLQSRNQFEKLKRFRPLKGCEWANNWSSSKRYMQFFTEKRN